MDLRTEVRDGVATVALNRPERRNALSASLRLELRDQLQRLDDDANVRVIVLTGSDPAFSAGVDLTEIDADGPSGGLSCPIPRLATPTIAAVNGPAVTGGLELALRCHIRLASERARFADTHARVGLLPAWGLTVALPRLIGPGRAREMSATGNYVDAQTAGAWGLVNRVVPHEELMPEALKLAADIASTDPACVRRLLGVYDEVAELPISSAFAHEEMASRGWLAGLSSRGGVPDQRAAVIDRGRSQLAADPS